MLLLKVIVLQQEYSAAENSTIDPAALMQTIDNLRLADIAAQVGGMPRQVVDEIRERA